MSTNLSAAKLAANRANAKLSTGPKSLEGKARSAMNALRHGLLAKTVVVSTPQAKERGKDFEAHYADLLADLKPVGSMERTLVDQIAAASWRMHRARRIESAALAAALETPDEKVDELRDLRDKCDDRQRWLEGDEELRELLDIPAEQRSKRKTKQLHDAMLAFAKDLNAPQKHREPDELEAWVRKRLPRETKRTQTELSEFREKLKAAEKACPPACEDPYARTEASDALLRISRYEAALDRQFHRALTALHRHRQARVHSDGDHHDDDCSPASMPGCPDALVPSSPAPGAPDVASALVPGAPASSLPPCQAGTEGGSSPALTPRCPDAPMP